MPPTVPDLRADSPRTLAILLLSRLALNLQFRVVYPFLPAIARGLGVPLETASLLLAVRSLTGVAAPLYGLAGDRWGRRRMMLAGLGALVAGALAVAVSPEFGVALVAFALLGFSTASFVPAAQAYLGDNVPYERRGRVLGLLELAWGLSWLVGVPLSGFAIAGLGWRAPFWVIAGLGLLALAALLAGCRGCGAGRAVPSAGGRIRWAMVAPALAVNCLLVAANENVFVVYGAWLESRFGLAVTAIGLV
jgi:predicted MFS family arabinose efflux permease